MMGVPIDLLAAAPIFASHMGAFLPIIVFYVSLVLLGVLIVVMILGESYSTSEC
jgi:hypothetical protein